MKTIYEQLADLDTFLAVEEKAFEASANSLAAMKRPDIARYCFGCAHAYHNARCILHVAVLHKCVEPMDVLTVMAIKQAREGVPEKLSAIISRPLETL